MTVSIIDKHAVYNRQSDAGELSDGVSEKVETLGLVHLHFTYP